MSFIKPDHMYKCVVTSTELITAEKWPVAVNNARVEVPLGEVTELSGAHILVLQNACYEKPVVKANEFGQSSIVGYKNVPRFTVQILEDLTLDQKIGAVPIGEAYILSKDLAEAREEAKAEEQRVARKIPSEEELDRLPFVDLRKLAFDLQVEDVNNLKKKELISEIRRRYMEEELS